MQGAPIGRTQSLGHSVEATPRRGEQARGPLERDRSPSEALAVTRPKTPFSWAAQPLWDHLLGAFFA